MNTGWDSTHTSKTYLTDERILEFRPIVRLTR